jgi:hypothetical protein
MGIPATSFPKHRRAAPDPAPRSGGDWGIRSRGRNESGFFASDVRDPSVAAMHRGRRWQPAAATLGMTSSGLDHMGVDQNALRNGTRVILVLSRRLQGRRAAIIFAVHPRFSQK